MSNNTKNMTAISLSAVIALALGVAIGMFIGKKSLTNKPGTSIAAGDENLPEKTIEELAEKLGEVILPEQELSKLESAILQAAMGLFMAQAQSAGLTVNDAMQEDLKKSINEKYNRKYFSDISTSSTTGFTKEELIQIISFNHTEAGKKFADLIPQAMQKIMSTVQQDLSAWLPKTVETLVAKLKGGSDDKTEGAAPSDTDKKEDEKS